MISLASIEQVHASSLTNGAGSTFSVHSVEVLDVAVPYCWKRECDGSDTLMMELVKPLPGFPKGSVMSLKSLHALLHPAPKKATR